MYPSRHLVGMIGLLHPGDILRTIAGAIARGRSGHQIRSKHSMPIL